MAKNNDIDLVFFFLVLIGLPCSFILGMKLNFMSYFFEAGMFEFTKIIHIHFISGLALSIIFMTLSLFFAIKVFSYTEK